VGGNTPVEPKKIVFEDSTDDGLDIPDFLK
jgi:hypothetical protein